MSYPSPSPYSPSPLINYTFLLDQPDLLSSPAPPPPPPPPPPTPIHLYIPATQTNLGILQSSTQLLLKPHTLVCLPPPHLLQISAVVTQNNLAVSLPPPPLPSPPPPLHTLLQLLHTGGSSYLLPLLSSIPFC